jgi:hypothetical protein
MWQPCARLLPPAPLLPAGRLHPQPAPDSVGETTQGRGIVRLWWMVSQHSATSFRVAAELEERPRK